MKNIYILVTGCSRIIIRGRQHSTSDLLIVPKAGIIGWFGENFTRMELHISWVLGGRVGSGLYTAVVMNQVGRWFCVLTDGPSIMFL